MVVFNLYRAQQIIMVDVAVVVVVHKLQVIRVLIVEPYLSSCDARAKCSKCKGSTKETVNKVCPACSAGKVDCGICSGTGKIPHTVCSSTGHLTEWHNCQAHNIKDEHYYCTSNSYHGDNVSQYHK